MSEPGAQQGSGEPPEPTFADVLDNLSLDSKRSGKRRRRMDEPADEVPLEPVQEAPRAGDPPAEHSEALFGLAPEPPPGGGSDEQWERAAADPGPGDDPEAAAAAVRPYAWTRGRTRPAHEFAVETLVSTSEHGHDVAALTSVEHRAIAELCRSPRSVAEVAALLSLPLGVAKVLLGDMTDIGLVVVHSTASSSGDVPDRALMERVLSGLRRL